MASREQTQHAAAAAGAPPARRGSLKEAAVLPELRLGQGVSTADRFFVDEIWRVFGKEAAVDWVMQQNHKRCISDSSSTHSCDSLVSSAPSVSSAASAHSVDSVVSSASTERSGTRPVLLTSKSGRVLCFSGEAACKERGGSGASTGSVGALHPLLQAVAHGMSHGRGEDGASQAPHGASLSARAPPCRRNSSPPRLGFGGEGERFPRPHAGLRHTGSVDGGLQRLEEETRIRGKLMEAMSGPSSEDSPSDEELSVDRAGLLYTDAAHLVIE